MPRRILVAAVTAGLAISGCGDDRDRIAQDRVEQIRAAAEQAGLDPDVIDALALAGRGTTATFQVSYAGTGGASVVLSQDPPNRRVDVLEAGLVVESQVVRDGVAYRCTLAAGARPGDRLACARTQGAVQAPGAFSEEALVAFGDALVSSAGDFDLRVERRVIADVDATCLVAAPVAGRPLDGSGPGVDTICLSPQGAQLLVDVGGERLVADGYSRTVPAGTFDL